MRQERLENNKKIFEQFLDRKRKVLLGICLSYSNSKTYEVEDIYQEICSAIWECLNSDNKYSPIDIDKWFYTIAINTAINIYRREKIFFLHNMRKKLQYKEIYNPMGLLESEIEMIDFIRKQSQMDKAVTIMYLDGEEIKNIAETLDITYSNVTTRVNRIKKNLKTILER